MAFPPLQRTSAVVRPLSRGTGDGLVPPRLPDPRDRYVIIKKLAEGGMAEVFLARDSGSTPPRLCVVKQLHAELRSKKEHIAMFLDESDLAGRLSHPNVVRALDQGSGREGPFLVLEYLAGTDLDLVVERLRKEGGQLPWQLAVRVIIATAEGMAYAHELCGADGKRLNLVHRDLTPSNLFLTFDGMVKVLDFGIARADERRARTGTGMLKGKARYLAPEQIQGLPTDGRADQFALGAALFELLANRPLFTGDNELAVIHAIMEGRHDALLAVRPDVPESVDAVFRRMVSSRPEDRFDTMGQVANALKAAVPVLDARQSLGAFMRQHFGPDFEAHAALMGRIASASTSELRAYFERGTPVAQALADADRLEKTVINASPSLPAQPLTLPDDEPGPDENPTTAAPVRVGNPQKVAAPLRLPGELEELPGLPAQVESRPSTESSRSFPTGLLLVGLALVALVAGVGAFKRPPAVATGTLLVRSQPPGASITLDGQPVSHKTPAALADLQPGVHRLRLKHPDALVASAEAVVVAGQQQTLTVNLPAREGRVAFRLTPASAVVTVDGVEVPLDGGVGDSLPLRAGSHDVVIRAMGYQQRVQVVEVIDGAPTLLEVTLPVDPFATP